MSKIPVTDVTYHMAHMFWSCPRLHDYSTNIFNHMSKLLNFTLLPSIEIGVLGIIPNHENFRKWAKDVIAFASLLAWLKDHMMFLNLEKIKYNLRGEI